MTRNRFKSQKNYSGGRETNVFTKPRLPLSKIQIQNRLADYEDRRRFHPEGRERPAKDFRGFTARLKVAGIPILKVQRTPGWRWNPKLEGYRPYSYEGETGIRWDFGREAMPPWKLEFERPRNVLVCVRRKMRREVLHALGITKLRGIGRGGVKFTKESKFSC